MLVGIALLLAGLFLWELLEGLGLVGWGIIEIIRQVVGRGR